MIISKEFIEKGLTNGIGIKACQIKLLGGKYPLVKGWKEALIGKYITEDVAQLYLQLRDMDKKQGRKLVTKMLNKKRMERIQSAPIEKPIREAIVDMIKYQPLKHKGLDVLDSFMEYLTTHENLTDMQIEYLKRVPTDYHDYRRRSIDAFVYLVYSNTDDKNRTLVKIGYSKDPKKRLSELKTANPKVKLLSTKKGSMDLEWKLHSYFSKYHQQREWFAFPCDKDATIKMFEDAVEELRDCDDPLLRYKEELLAKWEIKPQYLNTNTKHSPREIE